MKNTTGVSSLFYFTGLSIFDGLHIKSRDAFPQSHSALKLHNQKDSTDAFCTFTLTPSCTSPGFLFNKRINSGELYE